MWIPAQCEKGGFGFHIGQKLRSRSEGAIEPIKRESGITGEAVSLGDDIGGAPGVFEYQFLEDSARTLVIPERMLGRGKTGARGIVNVRLALELSGRRLMVRQIRESRVA